MKKFLLSVSLVALCLCLVGCSNTQKDLFGEAPDHKYGKRFLSEEEKAKLFEELNVCQKLSDKQIIELLFGKKADIKLNFQSVDGNTTNARFLEVYKQIALSQLSKEELENA